MSSILEGLQKNMQPQGGRNRWWVPQPHPSEMTVNRTGVSILIVRRGSVKLDNLLKPPKPPSADWCVTVRSNRVDHPLISRVCSPL